MAPMSMMGTGGQGAASIGDITTALQGIIRQLSAANKNALSLTPVVGTFTLQAAATTVVTQPTVAADSFITFTPLNAAAATLMGGAKSLYLSARTVGVSFTVATANGAAATGTEIFGYLMFGI